MNAMVAENAKMAWQSLLANKMRSLLTMLGIIIGVAAVIALVSIGYGVQKDIEKQISGLGSNLLLVYPGAPRSHRVQPLAGSLETLTVADYEAITHLPHVANASPGLRGTFIVVAGNKNWTTTVRGVTSSYREVRGMEIGEGRYWTDREEQSRARVAVIGESVVKELFGDMSPLGRKVRIKNDPYTVIGVLESKGLSGFDDQDNQILAPFTTVRDRLLGITHIQTINVKTDSPENMAQVDADITNLLRVRHGIAPGEKDDFMVENMADVMSAMREATRTLTLFLGAVAAISLLVGGIGIMNIMLVSVSERTKEIGIRKALGATYRMIITQFLIEAAVIGLAGGTVGILCGIAMAVFIAQVGQVSTEITILPIVGSFVFSMLIGIVFGLYPARKAARLHPIDALHHE